MSFIKNILLSALVVGTISTATPLAQAYDAGYYAPHSLLQSGRWVKVKVTTNGVHQITYEQLRQMGFADPASVAVYGNGGVRLCHMDFPADLPDDQSPVPVMRLADKLIFYAEADSKVTACYYSSKHGIDYHRNFITPYGTYYLTDGAPAVTINQESYVAPADGADILSHGRGLFLYEEELYRPERYGALFFGKKFSKEPVQTVPLFLPSYDPHGSPTTVSLRVMTEWGGGTYKWEVGSYSNYAYWSQPDYSRYRCNLQNDMSIGTNAITETNDSTNIYPLTIDTTTGYDGDEMALDFVAVNYPRTNDIRTLDFQHVLIYPNIQANQNIRLTSLPANVGSLQIWDISSPYNPSALGTATVEGQPDQLLVSFPYQAATTSYGGGAYITVFDALDTLPTVEMMEEIPNQDLHALATPDLVIIATDNTESQANRLADLHRRYLGHTVEVINQRMVYNEFSDGAPSISAVRRLMRMFMDRGEGKTPALLLFGAATSDNRGLESPDIDFCASYIPIYETEDYLTNGFSTTSYVTDAFYGAISPSFNSNTLLRQTMQIAVGRIPASLGAQAKDAVDKIEKYLTTDQTAGAGRALIISDTGNVNGHTLQANEIDQIIADNNPDFTILHRYSAVDPDNKSGAPSHLASLFRSGLSFATFMGHGGSTNMGNEPPLIDISWVRDNPFTIFPLMSVASCFTQDIDKFSDSSLGATLVMNPTGGAIGVIGSSREVFMNHNHTLNKAVANAFAKARGAVYTGEIYRQAHNAVITSSSPSNELLYNTHCYNFEGDPLLPLYIPELTAQITHVNSQAADTISGVTVPVGSTAVFSGRLGTRTLGGKFIADTTFNGTITLKILAAADTRTTKYEGVNPDTKIPIPQLDLTLDDAVASIYHGTVTDGSFTVSGAIPVLDRYGEANTVQLLARESQNPRMAAGHFDKLVIEPLDDPDFDATSMGFTAPAINALYINDPDFASGDLVNGSNALLVADIDAGPSGLMVQSTISARQPRVTLDGRRILPVGDAYISYGADGNAQIAFPLPAMEDGRHTLELRVYNGMSLTAARSLTFDVLNGGRATTLAVEEEPVTTTATFSLENLDENFGPETTGRLVILDATGQVVDHKENVSFPYTWQRPEALPTGTYTARAYLTCFRRHLTTSPLPFKIF